MCTRISSQRCAEQKYEITLETYNICSSSQHSSNDYKSAVYHNEGTNISSPARRSEVSPIQYHVSYFHVNVESIKNYLYVLNKKVIKSGSDSMNDRKGISHTEKWYVAIKTSKPRRNARNPLRISFSTITRSLSFTDLLCCVLHSIISFYRISSVHQVSIY